MTVYRCSFCEPLHGRGSALSSVGCFYYDGVTPTNREGSYGCPQCAAICCALCAKELNGICLCGGELVHDVWFTYRGDSRLPREITQFKTLEDRLAALEELRSSQPMLQAKYNKYKQLIERCNKIAIETNIDPPENPGLYRIEKDYVKRGIISYGEVWDILFDYAIESNVDQMLALLSGQCLDYVKSNVSAYPEDEEGWKEREKMYEKSQDWYQNHIPYQSPQQMMERDRTIVTFLRAALKRHDSPDQENAAR